MYCGLQDCRNKWHTPFLIPRFVAGLPEQSSKPFCAKTSIEIILTAYLPVI
jgi:hypothetical protein